MVIKYNIRRENSIYGAGYESRQTLLAYFNSAPRRRVGPRPTVSGGKAIGAVSSAPKSIRRAGWSSRPASTPSWFLHDRLPLGAEFYNEHGRAPESRDPTSRLREHRPLPRHNPLSAVSMSDVSNGTGEGVVVTNSSVGASSDQLTEVPPT